MGQGETARTSKVILKPSIARRTNLLAAIACAFAESTIATTAPTAQAATPPGSWKLFASQSNGVPSSFFPTLAYSPETNTLFYSSRLTSPTATLGSVWSCDMSAATPAFTMLPQTGLVLPIPKLNNAVINVFSMTVDSNGEPIVGTGAPGNTTQTGQTMLYRFDKATNQWVAPPISKLTTQNFPAPYQPTNIMYQLTKGADGTIWGGGQWSKTYRSTDNGQTFTVIDEHALLQNSHPTYYTTGYPSMAGSDGAIYGIRVAPNGYIYEGTETAGVIYSSDNGATWDPLDYDSTNPNSSMARASNVGNVAGLGFTKDGKVVVQGAPGSAPNPTPDAEHLYLFDPINHTEQVCTGFPDYFFGSQDVHTIITAPNGTMFINTGRNTLTSGQPSTGGIYTSTDGLNWTPFNTGLTSTDNADFRSSGPNSMVAIGSEIFLSTTDGKIWEYDTAIPEPAATGILMCGAFLAVRRKQRTH